MKGLILLSVVCMQLSWSYGLPATRNGVGSYAYQDSSGRRYGGTYDLKDGQVIPRDGQELPKDVEAFATNAQAFGPPPNAFIPFGPENFQNLDDFFPEYFRNFENLVQEAFEDRLDSQKLAVNAAKKAFDLTSNRAGYMPYFPNDFYNFPDRFGFGFPEFGGMSGFGAPNAAFASAAAGPGFAHHRDAISPGNPNMPNVDVTHFSDMQPGRPNFYSVSSKSFSKSSNINGNRMDERGSETMVNNNGEITVHSVHS